MNAPAAQLRRVLAALYHATEDVQDAGPPGEGWKSDGLLAALWCAEEVLGLPHYGSTSPPGAEEIMLGSGSPEPDAKRCP